MQKLDLHILSNLAEFFNPNDIKVLSHTNHHFNRILNDEKFWNELLKRFKNRTMYNINYKWINNNISNKQAYIYCYDITYNTYAMSIIYSRKRRDIIYITPYDHKYKIFYIETKPISE